MLWALACTLVIAGCYSLVDLIGHVGAPCALEHVICASHPWVTCGDRSVGPYDYPGLQLPAVEQLTRRTGSGLPGVALFGLVKLLLDGW